MNKIITLDDGIQVEVEVDESQAMEISDHDLVNSSIDKLKTLMNKIGEPIADSIVELGQNINIESTKITVGVKVGVEGNFFVAKSTGEANIQVEMTIGKLNG